VTPNPGFKVTGYLKVEYLLDGARVFNCTKHSCRSVGVSTENMQKIGVIAENILLKALKHVLHHWQKLSITASVFVETFADTYRLSEEGFGYNYRRLRLQRTSDIEGRGLLLGQVLRCAARVYL